MPPRHFWWLVETLDGSNAKRSSLTAQDRKGIQELFNGNDAPGKFW
jgi:hypothetical protein